MSASTDGLREIDATQVSILYNIAVGEDGEPGTAGQVLMSNGRDTAMSWVAPTSVAGERLTASTNITIAPDGYYDGSSVQTITASGGATSYTGGDGIDITGTIITADCDEATITNAGGTSNEIGFLKTLGALTPAGSVSMSGAGVFDGSTAITITGTDTTYTAGKGIEFDGTKIETDPATAGVGADTIGYDVVGDGGKLEVKKTAGTLTLIPSLGATLTFNGSADVSFTEADTTYTGGDGIDVTGTTISVDIATAGDMGNTLAFDVGKIGVAKVPEYLESGTGIELRESSGGLLNNFNGEDQMTISTIPHTAGKGIVITDNVSYIEIETDIDEDTLGYDVAGDGGKIEVNKVPNSLTAGSGITFTPAGSYDGSVAVSISASSLEDSDTYEMIIDTATTKTKSFSTGALFVEIAEEFRVVMNPVLHTDYYWELSGYLLQQVSTATTTTPIINIDIYDISAFNPVADSDRRFTNGTSTSTSIILGQNHITSMYAYGYITGLTPASTHVFTPRLKHDAVTAILYCGGGDDGYPPLQFRIRPVAPNFTRSLTWSGSS